MDELDVTASLRLRTSEGNHEEAIRSFPQSRIDAEWRKGQEHRLGRRHEDSGANVFLAEGHDFSSVFERSLSVIRLKPEVFRRLRELRVELELDIGVFSAEGPEVSFGVSADDMGLLAASGIRLRVSMYLSDDTNP